MKGHFIMSNKEINRITILEKLKNGEIKQRKASEILGLSVRQIRRLKKKYNHSGITGLAHGNRGRVNNRRIPTIEINRAIKIVKEHYCDFGPTFALEKLKQHHRVNFGRETLRKAMITANIWKFKKRKYIKVHQMRPRRTREGELVQIDGSPHAWFEDRGPKCTLLAYIDDATGKPLHLEFAKSESTNTYFKSSYCYLKKYGKPLALYSDKNSVFRINASKNGSSSVNDSNGLTQFGRAMKELEIGLIFAHSAQAKGRVERLNQTLQDRLVKELRLKGISNIKEANKYLPEFTRDYISRFAVKPRSSENAHRPLLVSESLEKILVKKHLRVLSKNLEIQYKNKTCQIQTKRPTYALRHAKVIVAEDRFGKVKIYYKNSQLKYNILTKQPKAEIVDSKRLNIKVDYIKKQQEQRPVWKPGLNHPWRKAFAYVQKN